MTKLYDVIMRCPKCGLKKVYYVDYDNLYDEKIFADKPCKKCKPQMRIDAF